jgi:hypothetical protein
MIISIGFCKVGKIGEASDEDLPKVTGSVSGRAEFIY